MPPPIDKETESGSSGLKHMSLSIRQSQIVGALAEGKQDKEIACDLGISVETVGHHLRRLYAKLGVNSRAAAVARALGMR